MQDVSRDKIPFAIYPTVGLKSQECVARSWIYRQIRNAITEDSPAAGCGNVKENRNARRVQQVLLIIQFLNAQYVSATEIKFQNCEVPNGQIMSDSAVPRWVRQFNEGRNNVHDEELSG